MEQYTTATTASGEQIVVQTSNGQIQQQVACDAMTFTNTDLMQLVQYWFEITLQHEGN